MQQKDCNEQIRLKIRLDVHNLTDLIDRSWMQASKPQHFHKHVIFVAEYDVPYPRRYKLLIWNILNPESRKFHKLLTE